MPSLLATMVEISRNFKLANRMAKKGNIRTSRGNQRLPLIHGNTNEYKITSQFNSLAVTLKTVVGGKNVNILTQTLVYRKTIHCQG